MGLNFNVGSAIDNTTQIINSGLQNAANIAATVKGIRGASTPGVAPAVIYRPTFADTQAPLTKNEKLGLGVLAVLALIIVVFLVMRK